MFATCKTCGWKWQITPLDQSEELDKRMDDATTTCRETICYRCCGAKEVIDYDESRIQGKDVLIACGMCGGTGKIMEDIK